MTPNHETLRIACLISGGGRTVLNLQEAIERGEVPASIDLVVAHRADLPGVERCRAAGLDVTILPATSGADRNELSDRVDAALDSHRIELICLAGYLRHFRVAPKWSDRVINIHPSLLPHHGGHGMYGNRVHAAVLAAGDRQSGCTVHAVDDIYDHGAVILQRECPVRSEDTVDALADRVFREECLALPLAIAAIARGDVTIIDGRVESRAPDEC